MVEDDLDEDDLDEVGRVAAPAVVLERPANASGRPFLVYGNYDVLLKWNRSHSFAIAVGTLADRLRQ